MYHFKLFLEADIKHKGSLLVQTNLLAAMLKLADINFAFVTVFVYCDKNFVLYFLVQCMCVLFCIMHACMIKCLCLQLFLDHSDPSFC